VVPAGIRLGCRSEFEHPGGGVGVMPNRRRTAFVVIGAASLLIIGLVAGLVLPGSDGSAPGSGDPASSNQEPQQAPSSTNPTVTTTEQPAGRPGDPVVFGEGSIEGGVRTQTGTVIEGIVQRPFTVLSPAEVEPGERLPVVVVLHGRTVDSARMSRAADWRGAVARDRFVAVFPQGVLDSWNAGPCCPPASALGTNDVAYLEEVLRQLDTRPDVDPARRYLTGFSNGAVMAYSFACQRPGVFDAVAPLAGSNLSGCAPGAPVSLLHQHGDPDPVVPYDGRPTLSQVLSSAPFPQVPVSVAAWARSAGCDPLPQVRNDGPGVVRQTWIGCAADARVELLTYPGNDHRWPDAPVDGLDELLRFFGIRR